MEKIPKMSGVLRGNSCETCCNMPQKTLRSSLLIKII